MKLGGIVAIIVGIVFSSAGAYGFAGGTGITFTLNERVVTAQEAGMIFSILGAIVLPCEIALIYIGFKPSPLVSLSTVSLWYYLLTVYVVFQGGYSIVGGIAAVVFGCLFLVTLFYWARRG